MLLPSYVVPVSVYVNLSSTGTTFSEIDVRHLCRSEAWETLGPGPCVAWAGRLQHGATSMRGMSHEYLFAITVYRNGRIAIDGKGRHEALPEILRMIALSLEDGRTPLSEYDPDYPDSGWPDP